MNQSKAKNGTFPKWMRTVLIFAGIYNILFGLYAVLFPSHFFQISGMELPLYIELWQCIGMIVGVFGIGYLIAAINPVRHYPMVLVGLLGKIFGPIGFAMAVFQGTFPLSAIWMIVLNDLIWWIPFLSMLHFVYKKPYHLDDSLIELFGNKDAFPLEMFETSDGYNLEEMSHKSPTLVVFLRHFGCTFCRESLQDLQKVRNQLEIQGTRLAVVHMIDPKEASKELERYGLADIPQISDPECILYKKFGLKRGSLTALFGLKVWIRGFFAGLVRGNSVGLEKGDGFQMPGVFLLFKGNVLKRYVHSSAADRPNYVSLSECNT